jgi:predicted RNA binding protein YcfA (HicA-like mRNA interferase family)
VSGLPVVSGCQVVKALEKIGYVFDRQRGSHMILRQPNPPHRRLTSPIIRKLPREHCARSCGRLG